MLNRRSWWLPALLMFVAAPLTAQGHGHDKDKDDDHGRAHGPKHYVVSRDRAYDVTRDVLVRQGYEVVRIEDNGPDRVVWYRRGNMGRGKGKGPPVKMVIHREADHVVFVDTPSDILVNIDLRLHLP